MPTYIISDGEQCSTEPRIWTKRSHGWTRDIYDRTSVKDERWIRMKDE